MAYLYPGLLSAFTSTPYDLAAGEEDRGEGPWVIPKGNDFVRLRNYFEGEDGMNIFDHIREGAAVYREKYLAEPDHVWVYVRTYQDKQDRQCIANYGLLFSSDSPELKPIVSGIEVGAVYAHAKGNLYVVESLARDSETLEVKVVYRDVADTDKVWVRPASMWFEEVEAPGGPRPRFTRVESLPNPLSGQIERG